MIERGYLYDCKHLTIKADHGDRVSLELASNENFNPGTLPPLRYHCLKLDVPCPYVNESVIMATRGKKTSQTIAEINNLDRILRCEDREDSEYAHPDHTIHGIRFYMQRIEPLLDGNILFMVIGGGHEST